MKARPLTVRSWAFSSVAATRIFDSTNSALPWNVTAAAGAGCGCGSRADKATAAPPRPNRTRTPSTPRVDRDMGASFSGDGRDSGRVYHRVRSRSYYGREGVHEGRQAPPPSPEAGRRAFYAPGRGFVLAWSLLMEQESLSPPRPSAEDPAMDDRRASPRRPLKPTLACRLAFPTTTDPVPGAALDVSAEIGRAHV